MSTEPSITLEQTLRLGQSPEETQKHVKPLKQEAEITKMNRTFTHSPRAYSKCSSSNPRGTTSTSSKNSTLIRKCTFFNDTHNKFSELKSAISTCTSFKFFHPRMPSKITCDASKNQV